ncbi:MAG: type IV secretory system conjugative DNA transfer family protein [Bacilli bacterium]|nr:type IV secretory system conjugative DNA transfer family protein [Bacilli bacterium]
MKLKIRIDSEDLMMFIIFAIFLLYIVAILVVNLSTFATEGYLAGPNPIPAFTPKYLPATITFYIIAIVGLFVSVSSYFFEWDKGFGLTTDKKDKGYSRWSKEKEIIESKNVAKINVHDIKSTAAGTPLLYKGDDIYVDNGENHTLVIGATGSGKTQTIVKPTVKILAKKGESMIITDPKGEIFESTAEMLKAKGYDILLLNFRDPQNGNAWNPMDLPYKMYKSGNQDKAIELLDDLALNILYDENNKGGDPFWEKTSADYFSGVALGLFEDAKEDEININSISLATSVGEDKFGGSTYIKEYFQSKDPTSAAYINASSTVMAANETKQSILSVFKQKIKLFASRENLSEMLSHSDIDLRSIGKRPTVVYIVIQDEKKTYHSLVTILLKQIYETLIGVAQENKGALPVRTNFILDEFANMPPLKDVTTMITAARSRQIRFTMIIQNFAQLEQVYGKENAETLRGNCGNLIYLVTTELKALEEISKMCGEVKSKKDEKTASTPLVTISDLQHMKENEVIILRLRQQPFKTKFTPDWKIDWGKKFPQAKYPEREKLPVHTFDIKEFVKAEKKKKLLEMMNSSSDAPNDGGTSPFIPGAPGFPMFGPNPNNMGPNPFLDALAKQTADNQKPVSRQPQKENNTPNKAFNPFMDSEFIKNKPNNSTSPLDGGFNVDDLVKKIDAKIAELEEEERRNKKEENKKEEIKNAEILSDKKDEKAFEEKRQSSNKTESNNSQISLDLDDEDDDEFFDDFFDN